MAGKIKFNLDEVKKLVDDIENATEHMLPYEELFSKEPTFLKDGVAKRNPKDLPYTNDEIDFTKVEKAFRLVKDNGIYLLSNAMHKDKKSPRESGLIVYAEGFNPEIDGDIWDKCRRVMGGDDCVISIPLDWYNYAIEKGYKSFIISVSAKNIGLVSK